MARKAKTAPLLAEGLIAAVSLDRERAWSRAAELWLESLTNLYERRIAAVDAQQQSVLKDDLTAVSAYLSALRARLEAEGTPHVLQLNLDWEGDDWRNPRWWHLYADGTLVLEGDGEYARSCFVEDEEAFLTALREGVEAAGLPGLSQDEYRLLCRARDIARHEPHDAGSHELGGTPGRVF